MLNRTLPYIWDFIPVSAIVLFHRHNFSKHQDSKKIRDDQSQQSQATLHLLELDQGTTTEEQIQTTISQSLLNAQ